MMEEMHTDPPKYERAHVPGARDAHLKGMYNCRNSE